MSTEPDTPSDRPPEQVPKPEPAAAGAAVKRMGDAWMIAPILPAAIVIGYLVGYGLDRLFGTSPWCTVVFCAIGVAAGFREVIRIALRVGREEDEAARHSKGGR